MRKTILGFVLAAIVIAAAWLGLERGEATGEEAIGLMLLAFLPALAVQLRQRWFVVVAVTAASTLVAFALAFSVSLLNAPPFDDRQQYPFPIVVFLDLNMPKKNGLEVLAWIRSQPELKKLVVHVLTASVRSTDVERAFELGANSYLIKPSRFDVLVEMIKAWLTMARRSAFPFPEPEPVEEAPAKHQAHQHQP